MDNWNAFCTVHYFLTGEREIMRSNQQLTIDLYYWYMSIEEKDHELRELL